MNEREKLKALGELGCYAAMDTRLCKWADEHITELEQQLGEANDRSFRATEAHVTTQRQLAAKDALLRQVKDLLPDVEYVESEYDGQSYNRCPSCGANDLMTTLEHRKGCLWMTIKAAIDKEQNAGLSRRIKSANITRIDEALAATADLAGLVVCDAKPAMKVIRNEAGQIMAQSGDGGYFDISTHVGKSFYLTKEKS